jgi:hypothetical protein
MNISSLIINSEYRKYSGVWQKLKFDGLAKKHTGRYFVIPAKAGIQ